MLLQIICDNAILVRCLSLPAGVLVAVPITAAALRPPSTKQRRRRLVILLAAAATSLRRPRHGRRRGVRRGLPTEVRRHRPGRARTWPGSRSVRTAPPPKPHALDDLTDERLRRWRVANLIEPTCEADLDALLRDEPIGATR